METGKELEVIEKEILPLVEQARKLQVNSEGAKTVAKGQIEFLKGMATTIEERFHPSENKKKAYALYQQSLDTEKKFYEPINQAIDIYKGNIKEYERQIALEEQRKAREAEAKRLEEERKEREKLEAQAKKAEEKGKTEKAEQLRQEAEIYVAPPVMNDTTVKTKKLIWKAKVINMMDLCKAIVSGQVPYSVLEINQTALNSFAKMYDGETKIQGLSFYQDVSSRI